MTDPYAPFPETELLKTAEYHDSAAKAFSERSFNRFLHEERSLACRNAVASYKALQERFCLMKLRAETGISEDAA